MEHDQANAVAQAIALAVSMAVKPIYAEIANLEVRVSNVELKATPIGGGDQNPYLDKDYSARLMNALEREATRKSGDPGANLPAEPVTMMNAPAEPEPPPAKPVDVQFGKGMMQGGAVYVARAVLPNQEGVITYKRVGSNDLPSITIERPDGTKVRYQPVIVKDVYMLPKVPLTYTEDQRPFLSALRQVAADGLILRKDISADWEIVDTRPATGPRGEARYASYVIESKDYVRRTPNESPVRIQFRGTAIAGPSSVTVSDYQLIQHPFYADDSMYAAVKMPAIIDQFTE